MKCWSCNIRSWGSLPLLAGCLGLFGCVGDLPAEDHGSPGVDRAGRITPVVEVFKRASPAVVNLSTTTIVTMRDPLGMRGIFEDVFDFPSSRPRQYEAHSVGSGFLIHAAGYLVTNAHVIDRAAEVKITFADGAELAAEEIARDKKNDLAVLKVDADRPLPFLTLGHSNDLMPGETVIAIGNPFGYQNTVTTGIISALDRELRFDRDLVYSGLIQTDASINPGNSGGPLLNVLGELIGVNTAIRGDAQNIGFAIPVDHLHALLPAMLDIERIRRVRFGAHFADDPNQVAASGVRVDRVDADSPAAEAGVRPGDMVTAIDGAATPNFMEAFSLLSRKPAGHKLKLDLTRDGSGKKSIDVLLADIAQPDSAELLEARFGFSVRALDRQDLRRLGLRRPVGLLVTEVRARSQAAKQGIQRGDLLTMLGGWPVTSTGALGHLISQVDPHDRIPFQLLRIRQDDYVRFELVLQAE